MPQADDDAVEAFVTLWEAESAWMRRRYGAVVRLRIPLLELTRLPPELLPIPADVSVDPLARCLSLGARGGCHD